MEHKRDWNEALFAVDVLLTGHLRSVRLTKIAPPWPCPHPPPIRIKTRRSITTTSVLAARKAIRANGVELFERACCGSLSGQAHADTFFRTNDPRRQTFGDARMRPATARDLSFQASCGRPMASRD
jgi:hypothetical protein